MAQSSDRDRENPADGPPTPPHSASAVNPLLKQTPHKYSTGTVQNTSEFREDIDATLKEELTSTLRLEVPDFVDAVFENSQLKDLAITAFSSCQEGDDKLYEQGTGWAGWPEKCNQNEVLEWLGNIIPRFTTSVRKRVNCRRIYAKPNTYPDGSDTKRKMDTGFESYDETSKDDPPHWNRILVVGELKSNPTEDNHEKTWLGLAQYAREVFRTQDRRFVLGFTLCGSTMRLWQFDRSGSSGSNSFDINQDGLKFVHIMLGFHLMDNEQLGLDPTIYRSNGKRYIDITRNGQVERLALEKELRKQVAVTGRATTCWEASYGEGDSKMPLVVKDSWQYEERPEEGKLIKAATEAGVKNIAYYYHHETVQIRGKDDDIFGSVRKGRMKACDRRKFTTKFSNKPPTSTSNPSLSQSRINTRKRVADTASIEANAKRLRSSPSINHSELSDYNRIRRRIITSRPGKSLGEASSLLAMLNGFIGAISGHKSLLLDAKILHRDISIGNIMLDKGEEEGFLIDLDLAIRTDDIQPSGAPSRTGTKVFMAIDLLYGDLHTFMHDLESFFWVVFWICVHFEGPNKEGKMQYRSSKFEKWNYMDPDELANAKLGKISRRSFRLVDKNSTVYCQPLLPCLKGLHEVLFENGELRKEDLNLYSGMIKVLEKARNDIEAGTVGQS